MIIFMPNSSTLFSLIDNESSKPTINRILIFFDLEKLDLIFFKFFINISSDS